MSVTGSRAFRLAGALLVLVTGAAFAGPTPAGDGEPVNAMCPVMPDEAVDPAFTLMHEGRTIGFCCRMCRADFRADPEAYQASLALVAPAAASTGAVSAAEPVGVGSPPRAARPSRDRDAPAWLPAWVGRSHVVLVHFPVALLIAAALAELVRRRGDDAPRDTARFCLVLGALGALAAAATGWARAEGFHDPASELLFQHRWLGVGALTGALVALVLAGIARRPGATKGSRRGYRAVLYVTALVVAVAGHHGGELAWGESFLFGG